jgi:uncharacterized protein (TIGR03437 family)
VRQTMHRSQPFSSSRILFALILLFCAIPTPVSAQISWNFAGPQAAPDRVIAVAADPRSDMTLYVATPGGGLWKTLDGGSNWTPLMETVVTQQFCSVAIDPAEPDVIYAGTGDDQNPRSAQGVGRSPDGGRTWTFSARFTNQPVCALAVDPYDSSRVFAGSAEGLYRSADAGASFEKVLSTATTSIAFAALDSMYVGILDDNVLAHSTDGGRKFASVPLTPGTAANWVSVLINDGAINVLVSHQTAPGQSMLDFYRSSDEGTTWSETLRIGPSRPPVALVADPLTRNMFSVGSTLLGATNKGSSWYTIVTKGSDFHSAVFSGGLAFLSGDDGLETAALSTSSSARTVTQLPIGQFSGVAFDSTNSIWGAGPAGLIHLFPFTKAGETRVSGVGAVGTIGVGSGSSPNVIAAGSSAIYTSTDRGGKFTQRTVIPESEARAPNPPFLFDPVVPTTAYVAGTRLYRTSDSGTTWTALSTIDPDPTRVVVALAMSLSTRSVLYAATACVAAISEVPCPASSVFWRSTNSGVTWTQVGPIPGIVTRIAVDPRITATVYASTGGASSGDVLVSTAGGGNWFSLANNLPDVSINSVIIDANVLPPLLTQAFQTLYVATDAGVFATYNAGLHWTDISGSLEFTQSLPRTPVTDLALRSDGTLLAATFGRGIYYTSTFGSGPSLTASPLSLDVSLMQGTSVVSGITVTNLTAASTFGYRLGSVDPWITIPEPNGEVRPNASVRVGMTISSAGLSVGTHIGRLQLIGGTVVQNLLVRVRVTSSPSKLTLTGGGSVTGGTGTTLPPIQVKVTDAADTPIPGVQVRFTITSGGGTLSLRNVATNFAGIATTLLTLPSTPGTVRISITAGDLATTLTATAVVSPTLFADSVVDGVTFNAYTSLGPGSVVSASGQNLAEGIGSTTTRAFLVSTLGTEQSLQVIATTPTNVRAVLPPTLGPGTYRFRIEVSGRRSNDVSISVATYAPGIFTQNGTGKGMGVFLKPDGSVVSAANPADRGTIVTFHASGLGAVAANNTTLRAPRVYFDIFQAELVSSVLSPALAGRYQVAVRVPALLSPATNISVSLTIGGYTSNRVTIPVR